MVNPKHPTEIPGYEGRTPDLIRDLGNLDYRTLRELLEGLGDNLASQARADEGRGREQLASALFESSRGIHKAVDDLDRVCKICEPYMEK